MPTIVIFFHPLKKGGLGSINYNYFNFGEKLKTIKKAFMVMRGMVVLTGSVNAAT